MARGAPSQFVRATVYGAAGRVGGSLTIIEADQGRWMVDCGSYYPDGNGTALERAAAAEKLNQELPLHSTSVDGLFLTHAHIDHIGRTLLLVRNGYSGPIYLTAATAVLAPVMLRSQARYDSSRTRKWSWSRRSKVPNSYIKCHWEEECEWISKIADKNLATRICSLADLEATIRPIAAFACKVCADIEVARVSRLFQVHGYGVPFYPANGVEAILLDAGHIPGSASVLLNITTTKGLKKILVSGDLGNNLSNLFKGPDPAPPVDAVIVETTYGSKSRDQKVENEFEQFRHAVANAVTNSGRVWIPAFALDRTQKILNQLAIAQAEGVLLKDIPIYCYSPTAKEISRLYREKLDPNCFRPEIVSNPKSFSPVGLIEGFPDSEDDQSKDRRHIKAPRGPCILITTSGMMDSAFSEALLPELMGDVKTSIFLVGWQDPKSPGGQLKALQLIAEKNKKQDSQSPEELKAMMIAMWIWFWEDPKSISFKGTNYIVRAALKKFDCFSGHGDSHDIDSWLDRSARGIPLVLVHGDGEKLQSRFEDLTEKGWTDVRIARPGDVAIEFR